MLALKDSKYAYVVTKCRFPKIPHIDGNIYYCKINERDKASNSFVNCFSGSCSALVDMKLSSNKDSFEKYFRNKNALVVIYKDKEYKVARRFKGNVDNLTENSYVVVGVSIGQLEEDVYCYNQFVKGKVYDIDKRDFDGISKSKVSCVYADDEKDALKGNTKELKISNFDKLVPAKERNGVYASTIKQKIFNYKGTIISASTKDEAISKIVGVAKKDEESTLKEMFKGWEFNLPFDDSTYDIIAKIKRKYKKEVLKFIKNNSYNKAEKMIWDLMNDLNKYGEPQAKVSRQLKQGK